MTLAWSTNAAERLVYREFERPGVLETEEEAGEGGGEGGEEGGTGAPQNTTRPRVKGEAREGQVAGSHNRQLERHRTDRITRTNGSAATEKANARKYAGAMSREV